MISAGNFSAGDDDGDTKATQPKLPFPASALPPARADGPPPATVLVVDDDEDIRKLVTKLMVAKGHRVVEAGRGLLALSLVQEEAPDLIVLDGMLPEVHGFDIVRRLKGSQKYGHIPIVLMSAVHRGWRIAADMRANYGIEEFVEKPFRIADLDLAVARALEHRSGEKPRDRDSINREAQALLEQGIVAFKRGDIKGAIELLKKGVLVDPLAYRLRYHLGLLFGRDGQVYEAVTELERAIELNPTAFQSLKNLAVLYEQAGFKNKATDMWERSLVSAPDDATRAMVKQRILALLPA
jgi:CheY-like chemotaxis protein